MFFIIIEDNSSYENNVFSVPLNILLIENEILQKVYYNCFSH